MYHRVLSGEEVSRQSVQPGMYVLDTVFLEHMRFLKDNFTVLSLQELLRLWQTGTLNEQSRYCVVTFDDGWLDNYSHAYPILKRLGLPATIFLPTDYVGSDEWFWPDQLSLLLREAAGRHFEVEAMKKLKLSISPFLSADGQLSVEALLRGERVTDQIIDHCKPMPIERIRNLIESLASELKVVLPKGRVIMNWDEVREMSRNGISFGSHSCSHRILTTIAREDVLDELMRSRQVLLLQGVNYVPVFCYPNGNNDSSIQSQVQACGYEAAVTVQMGVEGSRPENQFAIKRVGIHNDVTNTLPLFSLRLFGPMPRTA
ncbi:MAG: putative Polysaccharide deacetylase [Nitrospira sp.]|nr:putative Polysaccharide deacetylase [Nitrospira sp.]